MDSCHVCTTVNPVSSICGKTNTGTGLACCMAFAYFFSTDKAQVEKPHSHLLCRKKNFRDHFTWRINHLSRNMVPYLIVLLGRCILWWLWGSQLYCSPQPWDVHGKEYMFRLIYSLELLILHHPLLCSWTDVIIRGGSVYLETFFEPIIFFYIAWLMSDRKGLNFSYKCVLVKQSRYSLNGTEHFPQGHQVTMTFFSNSSPGDLFTFYGQ